MNLSIVITTYNGLNLLKTNLPFVINACTHWQQPTRSWEIIVVDDASSDNTAHWLKANYPTIKLLVNPKNLRFAKAVNAGVSMAGGDIVVVLNNDVKPKANFLTPLLDNFSDPQVFAVGCLEENIVNGKKLLGGRGVGKFSRGFLVHSRAHDQTRTTTLWVSAGSGAFRKSIWNKLGGLDPLYRPAYEEDRDISYNALKSGYNLVFEPRSQVVHHHETTNLSTFGQRRIAIMSFKNQLLFVWKNISSLKLFGAHLLWLPYHLIFTSLRSQGEFLLGFLWALIGLPEALLSRYHISKFWKLSDEHVI